MWLVACAKGFPNYLFPLENYQKYVKNHDNYKIEPCVASTLERVDDDELTLILNGTDDEKNIFLTKCTFRVERDNQKHIYFMSEDGDRLDVTALFRVGKFYLADEE